MRPVLTAVAVALALLMPACGTTPDPLEDHVGSAAGCDTHAADVLLPDTVHEQAAATWQPWAIGGTVVVLVAAAFVMLRRRRYPAAT